MISSLPINMKSLLRFNSTLYRLCGCGCSVYGRVKFLNNIGLCVLIIITLLSTVISGFNIDIVTALVQRGPSGTHFGFSVSEHKDRGVSWLLVGAPLAHTDQPGVDRGGAVYRCSVDSSDGCQQIAFDRSGHGEISLRGKTEQTDEKSHQWFGATVHSGGENGIIVACAPRYVYFSTSLKRRDPVGTCWVSRGSFTGFYEYSPCRTSSWGYHRQGSCQAGFSASVTKDGRKLYIGAVGSWYWQGQVFAQDLLETQTLLSTRESPAYDDDSFLGYSTTVGEFSGDADIDVAVGMPKEGNLTGKVVIFTSSLESRTTNITGDQMGAYFGYSLTTADIDGDGFDDVVIGAPLYYDPKAKDQSYEKGRISIAYQSRDHIFHIKDHIDGVQTKARFGMSLANLGDINKDGYDDIAVGAPYDGEKGAGAVYIYLGGKRDQTKKQSQVIYAESINEPGLRTFGFSLSGGIDLDNNQYPDLLVGAYASDRAIFLKARPVVNVTASLRLERDKNSISIEDRDKNCTISDGSRVACVPFRLCFNYNGIGVENQIDLIYETRLDTTSKRVPRIFFLHREGENEERIRVTLNKGSEYCTTRTVYLSNTLKDKLSPIKVTVEYNLNEVPGVRMLKPVLNKVVPNVLNLNIKIRKNCGTDEICFPNLVLSAKSNNDTYIVGSKKKIELDIKVENRAEDAFEAMFYLSMPIDVHYVNIKPKTKDLTIPCYGAQPERTGINNLECEIGNPLTKTIEFTVIIEPSKTISSSSPGYTFIMEVNSTNSEKPDDTENNKDQIGIGLKVEVNMDIEGIPEPKEWSFNASEVFSTEMNVQQDIGPEIKHSYIVKNTGPSTIKKADITILWPTRDLKGNYLLYLIEQPIITSRDGKGFCMSITRDDLNPLGLQLGKVNTTPRPEPDALPVHANDLYQSDASLMRYKREINKYSSNTPKQTYPVDTAAIEYAKSCGPTNCTKIICTVYDLEKDDRVKFTIRSRLWKQSIERINLEEFLISSKIVALVTALPFDYNPNLIKPEIETVVTKIHIIGLPSQPIPLWLIILAIIIGLAILAGLSLALWKLGFFKRKRPPTKSAEREPLQSPASRNGYHYRKGDTSL